MIDLPLLRQQYEITVQNLSKMQQKHRPNRQFSLNQSTFRIYFIIPCVLLEMVATTILLADPLFPFL